VPTTQPQEAELPFARVCDNPDCDTQFTPIGVGTFPFLVTDTGGAYFCSETCKTVFEQLPKSITQELVSALEALHLPHLAARGEDLIAALSPTVTEIPDAAENVRTFEIISHPVTSLFACILSGDDNYPDHVGETGSAQTLMRVSHFEKIINLVAPGQKRQVIPGFEMLQAVPLEATVVVTVTKTSERNGSTYFRLESRLADGTELSKPTTVITRTCE